MNISQINEGAWAEKLWLRLKPPLRAAVSFPVALRNVPRFLNVSEFEEGQRFTITVPTARRTWWVVALVAVIGLWVALTPVIFFASFSGGYINRSYVEPYFNPLLFGLYLLPLLAATWAAWWWAFPRIRISADHEFIRIRGRQYDWDRARGFRLGYSLGGVERQDKQGPYSGLRMAYGPWGDDLPFLVRNYYAPAYVLFLNDALKAIEPRTATSAADNGIKPVMF